MCHFCTRTRACFSLFTGNTFVVLGGQHSVAALQRLRAVRDAERLAVSLPWLETVRAAKILRYGTPVPAARLFAGEHQAGQAGVVELKASHFLSLLLQTPEELPLANRVLLAHQQAGWPRNASAVC